MSAVEERLEVTRVCQVRVKFLCLLYTTAGSMSCASPECEYSECIYRIIGKVVVMHIVHLIDILFLYVLW